jgi:hypothetical protein
LCIKNNSHIFAVQQNNNNNNMHKGVICLTKAADRDEAISNVQSFLEQHGDGDVWDWYVIGGRWSGTLNTKAKEFFEKTKVHFETTYPDNKAPFLTQKMVEEQADALQKIWDDMGQTSKNPYSRNQYDKVTGDDDVVLLSDCVDVVNEWKKDLNAEAEEHFQKMIEEHENEKENPQSTMSAYYAGLYRDCKYDSFSFESNVYDIENHTNNPEEALKEPEKMYLWFAVMVDMHN